MPAMKFTVVTVCLNASSHLAEAMESVLGQSYPDLEYLVVDGGSTDGSLDLIRERAGCDRRLLWSSGPDRGISEQAKGEVIAFLHADDSYLNAKVLTNVAKAFEAHPKHIWATGGLREVDHQGRLKRVIGVRRYSRQRLLRNNIILHPATFVRREALARAGGFDPTLRYTMDYDLWLRLAGFGPPVAINQVLTNFRVHAGSISCANRAAVLVEEHQVRLRYLRNPFSRASHSVYDLMRYCHAAIFSS
jgi:glycosyltransferase involved in cell wall biosynthesis